MVVGFGCCGLRMPGECFTSCCCEIVADVVDGGGFGGRVLEPPLSF